MERSLTLNKPKGFGVSEDLVVAVCVGHFMGLDLIFLHKWRAKNPGNLKI